MQTTTISSHNPDNCNTGCGFVFGDGPPSFEFLPSACTVVQEQTETIEQSISFDVRQDIICSQSTSNTVSCPENTILEVSRVSFTPDYNGCIGQFSRLRRGSSISVSVETCNSQLSQSCTFESTGLTGNQFNVDTWKVIYRCVNSSAISTLFNDCSDGRRVVCEHDMAFPYQMGTESVSIGGGGAVHVNDPLRLSSIGTNFLPLSDGSWKIEFITSIFECRVVFAGDSSQELRSSLILDKAQCTVLSNQLSPDGSLPGFRLYVDVESQTLVLEQSTESGIPLSISVPIPILLLELDFSQDLHPNFLSASNVLWREFRDDRRGVASFTNGEIPIMVMSSTSDFFEISYFRYSGALSFSISVRPSGWVSSIVEIREQIFNLGAQFSVAYSSTPLAPIFHLPDFSTFSNIASSDFFGLFLLDPAFFQFFDNFPSVESDTYDCNDDCPSGTTCFANDPLYCAPNSALNSARNCTYPFVGDGCTTVASTDCNNPYLISTSDYIFLSIDPAGSWIQVSPTEDITLRIDPCPRGDESIFDITASVYFNCSVSLPDIITWNDCSQVATVPLQAGSTSLLKFNTTFSTVHTFSFSFFTGEVLPIIFRSGLGEGSNTGISQPIGPYFDEVGFPFLGYSSNDGGVFVQSLGESFSVSFAVRYLESSLVSSSSKSYILSIEDVDAYAAHTGIVFNYVTHEFGIAIPNASYFAPLNVSTQIAGALFHLTCVWETTENQTRVTLYQDGEFLGTGQTVAHNYEKGRVLLGAPSFIGRRGSFFGSMHYLKVFDYALSAEQVASQFAAVGNILIFN